MKLIKYQAVTFLIIFFPLAATLSCNSHPQNKTDKPPPKKAVKAVDTIKKAKLKKQPPSAKLIPGHLPELPAYNGEHPEIIPCISNLFKDMVCIPGGPFIRGSNTREENSKPQEVVWLQTFYIDKNEVTYKQYQDCVHKKKCSPAKPLYKDFDAPQQPMNGESWFDAKKYCKARGRDLPTEAQWEKAARGTDGRLYPWGNEPATCKNAIIMDESGRSCGVKKRGHSPEKGKPWPVGSRPAVNGLYDMAGNSFEWVNDWYTSSYSECGDACKGVDPKGPCDGKVPCRGFRQKAVRGGSWYWPARYATTVWRRAHVPSNIPAHHFGFRCAAAAEHTVD